MQHFMFREKGIAITAFPYTAVKQYNNDVRRIYIDNGSTVL